MAAFGVVQLDLGDVPGWIRSLRAGRTEDGVELDMGTPVDATPVESANACFTAAVNIPEPARRNRRAMSAALASAGLVNYPTEWWHWSYGEPGWAVAQAASDRGKAASTRRVIRHPPGCGSS